MRTYCALIVFLAWGTTSYVNGVTVDALKADVPPVVDGKLDDAIWQKGSWNTGFSRLNKPDTPANVQTHFKVAVDGSAVYFAVRADEPNPASLLKTITGRDNNVFKDDCLEFMIGADPDGERYIHIATNALGALYDAARFDRGNQLESNWNGDMTVAVGMEDKAWIVELRVPLVELSMTAKNTGPWRVNMTRQRYAAGGGRSYAGVAEQSTFAPLVSSFHRPDLFAVLQLPHVDLSPMLWAVESPAKFRLTPKKSLLICSTRAQIENQTGQSRSLLLRPKWSMGEQEAYGSDVSVDFADGQKKEVAFSFPVLKQGWSTLALELRDRRDPDKLVAVRRFSTELKHVPLAVEVTRPSYRNCIYATQSVREIRALARLAVDSEQTVGAKLHAALASVGKPDAPVAQAVFKVTGADIEMVLPIGELETGSYELTVALQQGEKVIAQSETVIKKLPRVENEWRFDENNVLLHNGKPILIFGWYSPPTEVMTAPDCLFNAAHFYGAPYQTVQELREYLDDYAAAGKVLSIPPYPGREMWAEKSVWAKPLTKQEAVALRQRIRGLKDHPGILAWYMADEPGGKNALRSRLRKIYEIVSDEDPYHPCIMLNNGITGIYMYHKGGDILMPDPYPQFLQNGFASNPIEKISKFVEACKDASNGKKALWLCPQVFNYNDYIKCNKENNRAPNFTELRNMFYQGVAHGVKGFLSYTYNHSPHYMSLEVGMPFLAKEMGDLKEAVLADDAGDVLHVDAGIPEHMHVSARRVGDVLYVFAVNTATKAQEVKFTLADKLAGLDQLYVVSEDRTVNVSEDGAFSDHFGLYGAHVYVSSAKIAKRATLTETQAEIARRDAARKRPGNLAFEDNGTKVADSSKNHIRSTLNKLFDGVYGGMGWLDGTSGKCPDWFEVAWPMAVTCSRVVVVSDNTVEEMVLLTPDGQGWKEIAVASKIKGEHATMRFPAVTTDRLRVEVRKNSPGEKSTTITEFEAYAN